MTPSLLSFIEFENRTGCLLSSYEYMRVLWTTHQTVRMAKCSARCSLAPSMFHHATLVSRSFPFAHPSSASKANIPLILRRRSITENVLCGIWRPGIFAFSYRQSAVQFITMCAAKYDVRFTIFWESVDADHVCHRPTAAQVQQRCHIALQHHLQTWSGWISWTVFAMCLQPPASSRPLTLLMDNNLYTRHPKAQVTLDLFLYSMRRRSS